MARDQAEVCYWRKCWGIRDLIIDKIGRSESDLGEYKLTITDINNIRRAIKYFNTSRKWSRYGHSVWEWREMRFILLRQRIYLRWLARYMKKNDVKVYFYDSY